MGKKEDKPKMPTADELRKDTPGKPPVWTDATSKK